MANAHDVAVYILAKQGEMTAMKLQKLVYYAQAWGLVWDEAPLFDDKIQAWAAGPVVRSLYSTHKGKFRVNEADFSSHGGSAERLTAAQRDTVNSVLLHYGKFTAEQLSDLTHKEQPWIRARAGMSPTERGEVEIDLNDMVDYYSAISR